MSSSTHADPEMQYNMLMSPLHLFVLLVLSTHGKRPLNYYVLVRPKPL